MSERHNGGPAFPITNHKWLSSEGMTLRDYFAAKAMQGMLAEPNADYYHADLAKGAYEIADAMLKAREQ